MIRHHQIDSLVQSLEQKLSKLPSFSVAVKQIRVLENEERSRSFVCLSSIDGLTNTRLQRLLTSVAECISHFCDVKEYEDDFVPHVSLLWFLNRDASVEAAIALLQQEFQEEPLVLRVTRVAVKVGDRSYGISLKST